MLETMDFPMRASGARSQGRHPRMSASRLCRPNSSPQTINPHPQTDFPRKGVWEIHLRDQAETMSPHHWIVTLIVGTLALPGAETPRLLTLGDSWADDLAADTPGK